MTVSAAEENHTPIPLSHLLDRSVFVASPVLSRASLRNVSSIPTIPNESILLSNSVQPTEQLKDTNTQMSIPRSPIANDQVEDAYDRFLMATSGVSRFGRGYQSNNMTTSTNKHSISNPKRNLRLFHSARRMPPAISSEDVAGSTSLEFGQIVTDLQNSIPRRKDDFHTASAVRTVTSAFKAFVNGKTSSKRQSGLL